MNRWLIAWGLLLLLAALALFAQYYLPYRPMREEAIAAVLAREGYTFVIPVGPLAGTVLEHRDYTILEVIDRVPRAMLVVHQYTGYADGVPDSHCTMLNYSKHHWLTGVRPFAGPGLCHKLPFRGWIYPMDFMDKRVNGTYTFLGIVLEDERIAAVRGMWSDGQATSVPVEEEGYFLFFREEDDLHIEWVVGLDAEGRELAETKMDNRGVER